MHKPSPVIKHGECRVSTVAGFHRANHKSIAFKKIFFPSLMYENVMPGQLYDEMVKFLKTIDFPEVI